MKPKQVVLLDLWKTLVTSHCREPVWNLQRAIGHRFYTREGGQEVFEPDDDFLRFCLTTPIHNPDDFVREACRRFGQQATSRTFDEFQKILQGEVGCVARFEDVNETLRILTDRGYTLGVVSNLWPFPAARIFDSKNGLGEFFPPENRIYSYEVGHRKPDPEIFEAAYRRFNVRPEDCIMIGDNLEADVFGARRKKMKTGIIDRPGEILPASLPPDVYHLRSLTELPSILEREG